MELVLDEGESTVGWVGEIQDRHETDTPKFIKKTIPIHEMYAKPRVSQRLLDDSSIDIEQWIVAHISKQMSMIENHSFLHGDGKDKPTGILHYALGDVTNGQKPAKGTLPTLFTNQEKGWITSDILIDATTTLPSIYGAQAMWLVSRSALAQLRLLKDPHTGRYLWQPSLTEGAPSTLLGFRVIVNDAMDPFDPKRSTTPILFGNFESGYQIVDRQGVHVLRDPYCAKPYVEFYTTKRVGGDVIHLEAFVAISCVSSS
jgi:HK97 family phage major capsid protein